MLFDQFKSMQKNDANANVNKNRNNKRILILTDVGEF